MKKRPKYITDAKCIIDENCSPDERRTFHHIYTRGSGGPDEIWNMIPICFKHHEEWHKVWTTKMAKKYPQVKDWLLKQGWFFDKNQKKWINEMRYVVVKNEK